MVDSALFSSDRGDWQTPPDFFQRIDAMFHFTLDVCASHSNALCKDYFTTRELVQHRERMYTTPAPQGCFSLPWPPGIYWMNPPYGRKIGEFVKRFIDQCRGNTGVALLPARTDTKWFQDCAGGCSALFIEGHIKFVGADNGAPFPSVLLAAGRDRHKLRGVMIEGVHCDELET